MQLHELKPKTKRRQRKTVGRGGKRGTTAGRGTKGQKARAGHSIRPEIRDQIKKIPKHRGHSFHAGRPKTAIIVKLSALERVGSPAISPATLYESGLIPRVGLPVKILADVAPTRALTIADCRVSAQARAWIEAAGGKVVAKA